MKRAALALLATVLTGCVAALASPSLSPSASGAVLAPSQPGAQGYATGLLTTGGPPAFPWRRRIRGAERFAAHRLGRVSFAVAGEDGVLRGHRVKRRFRSASVVKVMLMAAYLRAGGVRNRRLRAGDRALLAPMIRRSDNATASIVFGRVGADALIRLARAARMRDFAPNIVWGHTRITASDQARFMRRLGRYIPGRHRAYALRLLSLIVSYQRWGMPPARPRGWRLYFKGGFVPSAGGWRIHQVAQLRRGERRLGVAVLTDGNPSLGYGAETIAGVLRRLLRGYR